VMAQMTLGSDPAFPGELATGNPRIGRMLSQLDSAWQEFHASYAGLTDEQMLIPGVCGEWSVRDLIAHVTWWDAEALKHLPLVLEGGRPTRYSVTYGGIDAFNALMTERKADLTLDEVRQEAVETHQRLVAYIVGESAERILAEPRFRKRLRLDTFGHYPIHTAQIIAWREQHGRL
jgi:DinB superfamily